MTPEEVDALLRTFNLPLVKVTLPAEELVVAAKAVVLKTAVARITIISKVDKIFFIDSPAYDEHSVAALSFLFKLVSRKGHAYYNNAAAD